MAGCGAATAWLAAREAEQRVLAEQREVDARWRRREAIKERREMLVGQGGERRGRVRMALRLPVADGMGDCA